VPFAFDHSYARLPDRFYARVRPSPVSSPRLLAWNEPLADLLGLTREDLTSPESVQALAGNRLPAGAEPLALAYAGHQFGGFVPRLGDGRAILLGEIVGRDGARRDIQLKGAGPTPFSRGGDGRAAIGPVLREYLVSEAMAALGVPTTRALAAVATGEPVFRDEPLPGAVLARVASSHLRVGTFQYFAAQDDHAALAQLLDYALMRHYPHAAQERVPALGLLRAVMDAQVKLCARWLSLGFVHGVMNTDNTSIAGETLDYGPCAFLDAFDPNRTFSSIDQGGRYAFRNQPRIALWNLARLAEALLQLIDADEPRAIEAATALLDGFSPRFDAEYGAALRAKLGLGTEQDGDAALAEGLLTCMAEQRADYTLCFRRLADVADGADASDVTVLFADPGAILRWLERWRARLQDEPAASAERAAAMRAVNPAFIPRNHRVEEMIAAARKGDLGPFERLLRVLARPYEDQPDAADLAEPPGAAQWSYRTFCGT
jgi:serine/tyrosine/threonine adenylyltransferase